MWWGEDHHCVFQVLSCGYIWVIYLKKLFFFCDCLSLCLLVDFNCKIFLTMIFLTLFEKIYHLLCWMWLFSCKFESWFRSIPMDWIVLSIDQTWMYGCEEIKWSCIDNMWNLFISLWLSMCQLILLWWLLHTGVKVMSCLMWVSIPSMISLPWTMHANT